MYSIIEDKRLEIQTNLDKQKTQEERNKFGQFATPSKLASDILNYSKKLISNKSSIKFFDPAVGTGSFYSALISTFKENQIKKALGFEFDPHYAQPSKEIWKDYSLEIQMADFTVVPTPPKVERYNLVICNPPYVRHHHLSNGDKNRLKVLAKKRTGIDTNGLTGLYCYFMLLSHSWMEKNAIAGWLIPSEFMDVNYGKALKEYLINKVKLLRIHRFDPDNVQFEDALVSSTVVWFKNIPPPKSYSVEFSFGGTLNDPLIVRDYQTDELRKEPKWTRFPLLDIRKIKQGLKLSDLFTIKRGLATGNNNFFILNSDQINKYKLPYDFFKPILPSPRYLKVDEIEPDEKGCPVLDNPLYLLDCHLNEDEIKQSYPELWKYLKSGIDNEVPQKYLCSHREPWYSQEKREPAPILCTYMGRGKLKNGGKPFRFILNSSKAVATNVYLLLYPRPFIARIFNNNPKFKKIAWNALNKISMEDLLAEGRVYGGGLHKLEPKELSNVSASSLLNAIPDLRIVVGNQKSLF
jgi:predicted RNA methylase